MPPRACAAQALMEPMPGTHTIADLVGEMVLHVEVPAHRADFVTEMLSCQGSIPDVDTLRNNLNCHQFEALARLAQLSDQQIGQTKLLLGTVLNPFMFDLAQVTPLSTSTPGVENEGQNADGGKKKKGGSKQNISEVLAPRRTAPSEYFPPAAFWVGKVVKTLAGGKDDAGIYVEGEEVFTRSRAEVAGWLV